MPKNSNPCIYSVWNSDYKQFFLNLLNDEQIAYRKEIGIPYKLELVTKAKLEGKRRSDNGYLAKLYRGENGILYEVFFDSSAREAENLESDGGTWSYVVTDKGLKKIFTANK